MTSRRIACQLARHDWVLLGRSYHSKWVALHSYFNRATLLNISGSYDKSDWFITEVNRDNEALKRFNKATADQPDDARNEHGND